MKRTDNITREEWLGKDNKIGIEIHKNKYTHNNESFGQWLKRVSSGKAELAELIYNKGFLFAGRTLTNINTGSTASLSNCYAAGACPDSLEGILKLNTKIGLTYQKEGGQGISVSLIRPKGAAIQNGKHVSDGIITWIELFETTTAKISQGGHRKGALQISCTAWHPQIMDFINAKNKPDYLSTCNLSVEIYNEFITAAMANKECEKIFVINKDVCNSIRYRVNPRKILKSIAENAWKWGDPGIFFMDRFQNYNLMQFVPDYNILTSNPCGEQPLPENGACNLGSIILSMFVANPFTKSAKFKWAAFEEAVSIAVMALDAVIDKGIKFHALKEQKAFAKKYRNIGLGIMGLADMLIKMGIKYGSKESKQIINAIGNKMFRTAVYASNKLAKKYGAFPGYSKAVFDSAIINNHFTPYEIKKLKKHGLRNASLLSVAPCGSIGTMLSVSTGAEPVFAFSHIRKTESLNGNGSNSYKCYAPIVDEYLSVNPEADRNNLPDYFVEASEIPWEDRIELQGLLQSHIDTAISSTVNLPKDASVQDVYDLYLHAYNCGLKGITIFRDGCNKQGILTKGSELAGVDKNFNLQWGDVMPKPKNMIGKQGVIKSGCGNVHVSAWFTNDTKQCVEVWLTKGSTGGCFSFMNGLARMTSMLLRAGVSLNKVIEQLKSTPTCPSYRVRTVTHNDTSKGDCCPSALANMLIAMSIEITENKSVSKEVEQQGFTCPSCGNSNLRFEGGCNNCPDCGYTKCQ